MKTSLKINHDYLTVTVTEPSGKRLNLTVGRRGETASGKGQDEPGLRRAMAAFSGRLKRDGRSNQDRFEAMKLLGEQSATIDEFVGKLGNPV